MNNTAHCCHDLFLFYRLKVWVPIAPMCEAHKRILLSVLNAPFPKWPPQPHYINQARARLNIFFQLMDVLEPDAIPNPKEITNGKVNLVTALLPPPAHEDPGALPLASPAQ